METKEQLKRGMRSERTIKRELKRLRELIESTKDPAEQRVAQAMEYSIRWATEATVGWPGMTSEARVFAKIIHEELK